MLQEGSGNDTLVGGSGDDRLTSGLGAGRLECGSGFDRIIFRTAGESGGGAGRDVVAGFSDSEDQILLPAIDANGGAAGAAPSGSTVAAPSAGARSGKL